MPGQNAFAFNGTAFVPEDRNLTAGISVLSPAPTRKGVTHVYTLQSGSPATQVWQGFPPTPSAPTYTNVRTGTYPNLANSIRVDWTADESTITASFDVFVKIGTGGYSLAGNVGPSLRAFTYGTIDANTTYSFYVRANGVSGLNATGPESSTSLPGASAPTNLRETSTSPSSITWTWDFPAGTFQRFYVYRNGTYNAEVLPTQSATSATHTWSGLSENSSYTLSIQGQNYDGFWSPIIADAASTTNAAPSTPGVGVAKVGVASSPVVRTSTSSTQTRSFTVTVTPAEDPLFAEVYLEVSSDGVNWSALASWTDNTNQKFYTHSIATTSAITRHYKVRQRDNQNLYSSYSPSVSATSDAVWSHTEQTSTSYAGSGSLQNVWVQGQNLGVGSNWSVTSTFNNDVQTYGGDQAFDGDSGKAWRSASVTNARIRITFPISGNWVNGISAVEFWPAQAYNTYVSLSPDGGTTWFGTTNTPGTSNPYVEYVSSSNINPNVLNTIDVNPDRYIINGTPGSNSYTWAVRLEFTSTTARTFEVNQINVKQLRQNYSATPVFTTWYW
jgi:hypothetical protein